MEEKEKNGFVAKLTAIPKDVINWFKTMDGEKIMLLCQWVIGTVVAAVMTYLSVVVYYKSANTKAQLAKTTLQAYFKTNRSLMLSYTICAALTWIFLCALAAWAIGKLIRKFHKFN